MGRIMLGNEAVARGLYEAGCRFVSSYPGTPSTEITECAAAYNEINAEWAPNEKVACEASFGASFAGARSFSAMKHVGFNVAADPIFTMSYTGVNAGLVIAVADDMGMHSSQNEQDSRNYAIAAKLPMLEPSTSEECRSFVKYAYEISEKFDTPALIRLSTRVSHSRGIVDTDEREEKELVRYKKNAGKYVMVPANARARRVVLENRMKALKEYAETSELNTIEDNNADIGVIASGIAYLYAKEALGDKASYLKLGMINPLPVEKIRNFAKKVNRLIVVEELDDIIETHLIKNGIACKGKNLFTNIGEYSAGMIRERLLGIPQVSTEVAAPVRPPVLCPGCPHRGLFYVLNRMGLIVSGDIGCYSLGSVAPLSSIDMVLCMGASVSAMHGMSKAANSDFAGNTVGVIGDSTFIHSGITGLIDMVYNKSAATLIIADNSITGMTGHQQNPATGLTLKEEPTVKLDLEALCKAVGVDRVRVVDPQDIELMEKTLREELAADEPSVVIARRPCALLKSVKRGKPFAIDTNKCKNCRMCMRIGCPAISFTGRTGNIDASLCVGCGLCEKLCKFDAIGGEEE